MKPILFAGALALAVAGGYAPTLQAGAPATTAPAAATPAAPKLHAAMRALWQGHVERTRAYALAVEAGDAAAAGTAAEGVVANAKQIADAVAGFYGKEAGVAMLDLLAGHWTGVKALTDAAKSGDTAGGTQAMQALTANGTAIAKFLAGANPNLPEDAVFGLLAAHVAHHRAQVGEIMRGDMAAEAQTWSAMKAHMDTLADALSDGIAKQFADKAT